MKRKTNKALLLLMTLFFGCSLSAQLSKADAVSDLQFLGNALAESHPSPFSDSILPVVDSLCESLLYEPDSVISSARFRLLVGNVLNEVHCIHTSVSDFPLAIPNKEYLFPFPLYYDGKALYKMDTLQPLSPVNELRIDSINGIASGELMQQMLRFRSGDGRSSSFSCEYFNYHSQHLVPFVFDFPDHYVVSMQHGRDTLEAVNVKDVSFVSPYYQYFKTGNFNSYFNIRKDSVIYLKVQSFSGKIKREIKHIFRELDAYDRQHLVIDLRGNTGGTRDYGILLAQYLCDSAFFYQIVQPDLETGKYLDGKARFTYFLSKLKYNVFNFYRSRKTGNGRVFTYRYKPKRKHRFSGHLYIITDGYTASTSTMFTSLVRQYRDSVVIVGRQAGGGYSSNNGGSFPKLVLPASGVEISFPLYRIITDVHSQQYAGILPDFPIYYSVEDMLSSKDPDMEFILDLILSGMIPD